MSDSGALLLALRARGIRLSVDGERLVASPGRLLTADDREHITANKPALVALLTAEGLEAQLERSGRALQARWGSHGRHDAEATRLLDIWLALLGEYERIAPMKAAEAEWLDMAAAMRAVR